MAAEQARMDIVGEEQLAKKTFDASTYQRDPAEEDENEMTAPSKFALVGKFVTQRPIMEKIQRLFVKLSLKAAVEVQHLDFKHVLIILHTEEDYSRIWTHQSYNVEGCLMRLLKWTPEFHPSEESSIVPVWVAFPNLPIHLSRNRNYFYSLVSIIGRPLRMDHSTAAGTRPAVARALVEVDVRKEKVQRVLCGTMDRSFWQRVIYENIPPYCEACRHLGHCEEDCYVKDLAKKPVNLGDRKGNNTEEDSCGDYKGVEERNVRRPIVVRWRLPLPGMIRLSVDGCRKGDTGMAAGGGLFRQEAGKVLLAFGSSLGQVFILYAELWAVWRGVQLALEYGFASLEIESDSAVIVSWLNSVILGGWSMMHMLHYIRGAMKDYCFTVQHIYREANDAADYMANHALQVPEPILYSSNDVMPSRLYEILAMDSAAAPYIRQ